MLCNVLMASFRAVTATSAPSVLILAAVTGRPTSVVLTDRWEWLQLLQS